MLGSSPDRAQEHLAYSAFGVTMSAISVESMQKASLHRHLPLKLHAYAYPYLPAYGIYAYVYFAHFDSIFGSPEFASFGLILVVMIHALLFLVTRWSVFLYVLICCRRADIRTADCIRVVPPKFAGKAEVVSLEKDDENETFFVFQKRKYFYDADRKIFRELVQFPIEGLPFGEFKNSVGIKEKEEHHLLLKYGANRFDIPMPSFEDLMKEHVVAPFFVFQIFCVALWFLDEMWYYSLFTLVMLVVFESTVVMQFRTMSTKPYKIMVYRSQKWREIMTDELIPGDICSVKRSAEDAPVPCDLLLLDGSCIANEAMLSGESTPQLKEPVFTREDDEVFSKESDKIHVLFGGTKIVQVNKPPQASSIQPPDDGCIGLVMRTGFNTQQGELVRMILFSTERVSANNIESLFFILFLLIFAIIAAWYVWTEGMKNEERKKSKVLLDCILIITSVVPPELPMELSLAVNNSLISLAKAYVFCTEPFRIPFAGKIDFACFDKTGTLTVENLQYEGVIQDGKLSKIPSGISELVVASAHSLVLADQVVGDPMEKNTVEAIHWDVQKDDIVVSKRTKEKIKVLRRFPFSSALKRMSTLCEKDGKRYVAVKGAPEVLKSMYVSVPKDYDQMYKFYAKKGIRILSLGYKSLEASSSVKLKDIHREDAESNLEFAGFLVFYCPLKEDSKEAIQMLANSSHRVVMITGDNPLTACHVAEEVGIVTRKVLIGDFIDGEFTFTTIDEDRSFSLDLTMPFNDSKIKEYDLCITGRGLSAISASPVFDGLLPRLWVYARVSPSQKEFILKTMKHAGYTTLMCGDGTNDVGALEQAHVGIALLDGDPAQMRKIQEAARKKQQQDLYNKQCELRERFNMPPIETPPGLKPYVPKPPGQGGPETRDKKAPLSVQDQLKEAMNQMGADEEVPRIKFGDASVAAPFTSKLSSVMSVCQIVRQGRSTLVALIQMYKILALNCIITAYSMSVLYLAGIKQGDWQATIAGFLLTICFFGIAKSNALEKLSKKRPQPNIFNAYLLLSVIGQAAVHVGSLMYVRQEAIHFSEELYALFLLC